LALDGAGARVVVARGAHVQWRSRHELESGAAPAAAPVARRSEPEVAPVAAVAPPAPLPSGPFLALAVAPILPPTTAAESTAILDAHVQVIGAQAYAALARAWDSGRISTPAPTDVPFFAEVRGLLGIERGHAPAAVEAAAGYVDATVVRLRERCAAVGERRWPLAILRSEFGLSPLAAEILMIAAAPVLMGELARVYGIVANDPGRAVCDELMVCQLFAGVINRDQIAAELDRDRPLRRHGLILDPPGGERPFQALRVDPLVLRRLRAQPLDLDLDGGAVPYPATRPLTALRITAPDLAASLHRLESRHDPERPVRIAVRGRVGTGRRSLIAALAATVGRSIVVIDAATFPPAERASALQHALRKAALRGFVPLVDGLDESGDEDRRSQRGLSDVFRAHPGPLALRLHWDTPVPLAPGYVQIDLGTPSEGDRTATLVAALARHHLVAHGHGELASRYRVGPGVLERVVTDLARTRAAAAIDPQHDATDELGVALRQHITSRLGATATRVTRLAGWPDIVLPDDVIDSLREFVARVRHRRTVYETWGYDRKLTSARGVTALFTGSPGTGKTLVASAIAKDLGLDLYRVDLARVVSKWIGETERNLASVFDAAEDGQAVVLFDEADSLFTKRTEVKSSVDRYANLEVNYLLQRLDTFEGIAILTTNFGGGIDAAFKRRLSFRLTFPFPDEELRERLWRIHVPPEVPRAGELDFEALAEKYRLSGGYIRNAAVRAAFLAASEGAGLGQSHLERAVALEYREIGKLVESGTLE
ncbi:MAG: ATP-binding protein, partial [Deltaproteobacteria bacterium]|nr:ATP-binding protein [Deltaproteobacteria bacterium]